MCMLSDQVIACWTSPRGEVLFCMFMDLAYNLSMKFAKKKQ